MTIEQTLVLIKPDGLKKGIVGRVLSRFEEAGLKIAGLKMVWPDEKIAKDHYPLEEEWAQAAYKKTKESSEKNKEVFNFKDYLEFGKFIQRSLVEFITESPIIALVLEGPHAIEIVRKLVGPTEPRQALPGTIRGDFASIESYSRANSAERAVRNIIHASDSQKTAKKEISTWFSKEEIHNYKKHDEYSVF